MNRALDTFWMPVAMATIRNRLRFLGDWGPVWCHCYCSLKCCLPDSLFISSTHVSPLSPIRSLCVRGKGETTASKQRGWWDTMPTCGSQLGAGADITPGWLMAAHWDLGGGGGKRHVGILGHNSNYRILVFFLACLGFIWSFSQILVFIPPASVCYIRDHFYFKLRIYSFEFWWKFLLFSLSKASDVPRLSCANE